MVILVMVRSGALANGNIQKIELNNEVAMWKKISSRKQWIIRGRSPQGTGDSVADLQAIIGDQVEVSAEVAQQLRDVGAFNVPMFSPSSDAVLREGWCRLRTASMSYGRG